MADTSVPAPRARQSTGCRLLQCGDRQLDLSSSQVMGVLNVTPDSFSDGGRFHREGAPALDKALAHAQAMVDSGAAIIDVGGESTRPGAAPVSPQQEMERVLPVVEAIASRLDVVISVDTSTPQLMCEAAAAGAGLINDVRALEREGAVAAAARTGLPVCLMHMQGQPSTMQHDPKYRDVVSEVANYLLARVEVCRQGGIPAASILLDPGFGFGKTVEHNLALLNRLSEIVRLGFPVLVGLSRKTLIGKVLGRDVDERLAASLSLAVIAAERGAAIIRCHDVRETADALHMLECVKQMKGI